jgi:hypothetical protein
MNEKLRESLKLFKKYCSTFGLKPTAEKDHLTRWGRVFQGPIIAGAFIQDDLNEGFPPIAFVNAEGELWFHQDEDKIPNNEPVWAMFEPSVVEVSINNNVAIHPSGD